MRNFILSLVLIFTTFIIFITSITFSSPSFGYITKQNNINTLDATIPVLDLNDFYTPNKHKLFISNLTQALKEFGFFAVINSTIDLAVLDNAYKDASKYFSTDYSNKILDNDPSTNGQRGYVASESAKNHTEFDFKEFYHIGDSKNIWPSGTVKFEQSMTKLYKELELYADVIAQALSEAIDMPSNFFPEMIQKGDNLLRVLHYPAHNLTTKMWAAEHTDIDLFTILPRSTADGLQVLDKSGKWIDVKVPDHAFIVNAGDMLQNITNGKLRSSIHRVVNKNSNIERYSMVFFAHPRSEIDLSPISHLVMETGGSQLFPDATAEELLYERLIELNLATKERMKFLATSGFINRSEKVGKVSTEALKKIQEAGIVIPSNT